MNPEQDFELRRRLRALSGERPMSSDLWPAIQARLPPRAAPPARRRQPWPWALAAGLAMAVLAWQLPVRQAPPPVMAVADDPMAWIDAGTADVEALLAAYDQILAFEATRAPDQWQRRLARPGEPERLAAGFELDISLRDLAAALRVEPRSQLLRRLLHQTLHQRLTLSRDAWTA